MRSVGNSYKELRCGLVLGAEKQLSICMCVTREVLYLLGDVYV